MTIGVDSGSSLTITGVVMDDAATPSVNLIKELPGTLVFAGDNTYDATTRVFQGALRAAHDHALGTTTNGTLVSDGAQIQLAGNVTITGERISGTFVDNNQGFQTYSPGDPSLVQRLQDKNVTITARPESDGQNSIFGYLISWLPMLLILGVWIFFMRQMQSGSGRAMGFGKSKAKLLTEAHGRITFQDVAGVDEAKQDLEEIVEFLRDPQKFQRLGGKIPRGVLLVGPPGTGKTLLARSVAGEANVPFFSISGSDFVEMFVGVGASRVRDMFEQGKKNAPCIIFIDEIDAVGRSRFTGIGGGHDEREQTLNALLVQMDGFETQEGVIILAATNRPDVLDQALLRPGRFDRQIVIDLPTIDGRRAILEMHAKKLKIADSTDLHRPSGRRSLAHRSGTTRDRIRPCTPAPSDRMCTPAGSRAPRPSRRRARRRRSAPRRGRA